MTLLLDPPPTPRPPWQFGLRTMFVLMSWVSLLLLVMSLVGLLWSVMLLWFLLLASAHVVGNSWGAHGRAERGGVAERPAFRSAAGPAPLAANPAAVRLRHQAVVHRIEYCVMGGAAILGGGLGGAALWSLYWNRAGYSGIVVGTVSSAIVGGFLGFLCVTCARVALTAANEARASARPDRFSHEHEPRVIDVAATPVHSAESTL